jgi:hypothetical protein
MARGSIARFVATRAVDSPDGLKSFTGSNNEWSFDGRASSDDVFVFKRSGVKGGVAKPTAQREEVKEKTLKPITAQRVSRKASSSAKAPAAKKAAGASRPRTQLSRSISKPVAPLKPSVAKSKSPVQIQKSALSKRRNVK